MYYTNTVYKLLCIKYFYPHDNKQVINYTT